MADRITMLEDRFAVDNLVTRYAIACDDRDMVTLASCFAENGQFTSVQHTLEGRAAVRAYYEERFAAYGPTYHVPHRNLVRWTADSTATGTVLGHSEILMPDGLFVTALRYDDEYVKVDGEWFISSRVVHFLYGMPLSELAVMDPALPRRRWPGAEPVDADMPEPFSTWQQFYSSEGDRP